MRESIHKYFQVGLIHWMSYPRMDPVESIRRIACDDYFDVVEVRQAASKEEQEARIKILKQSHLKVCYGAQPRLLGPKLNPNDLDEEGRKKAEATLLEALDEAEELGAKGIAYLAGKYEEDKKEEAYGQLLKTTFAVCEKAKKKGMMVEVEVFDYDVDKAALIGPAPLAARFAADVRTKYDNFGLLVDLSHIPITHENSRDVIRTCRPYITHLHFGNAVADPKAEGYGDLHQRFGFPNSANDIPELVEYLTVLKEEGFFCARDPYVLSVEIQPTADDDEEIVLANCKRVLNRAWAMVED